MPRKFTIIIPSRYDSARFPGKALAMIQGRTMIRRVWERCNLANSDVYVATDDDRIADEINSIGGQVIMTSSAHNNGTSRCWEAAEKLKSAGKELDVIINIQGDEPFIHPDHITILMACFDDATVELASLAYKVNNSDELQSGQGVFLTMDKDHNALYFSRAVIPYNRDRALAEWPKYIDYYRHIGTYAYTMDALQKYNALPPSHLEQVEKLEQLRWVEQGYKIKMGITDIPSYGVDTPGDLTALLKIKDLI